MDRERVVPNQTVLVQGERIVAMGNAGEVAVPDGAVVIDGAGHYLLPGLTDAHVHLSTSLPWAPARAEFGEGPLYLANGVTTVINLGGSPEQLDWRGRVAAGALVGPTIYTAGEFINEPRMATPDQIEAAVRTQRAEGYDLIKFHERPNTTVGLSASAYKRMIDVAREVGMPLVGHAPANLGVDALLDAQQPLAHLNMLSNVYFLPIAAHRRTLFASAAGVAGVLAAALGSAGSAWRRRRLSASRDVYGRTIALLTAALAGGGLLVALGLLAIVPGGPGSESLLLRWVVTLCGGAFVIGLFALATAVVRHWRVLPTSSRVIAALATGSAGVLAWSLTTFWIPVSWRSTDEGMAELAARLHAAGVSVQSTLVVYDSLGGQSRRDMFDDPAISYLLPRTRALWAAQPRAGLPGYHLPAFTRRLTAALHRAGVSIVAGTDAMGMEAIVPGFSLHRELRLLRAAGLTPYDAIFAATRAPAAFLGRSTEFGRIAVGLRADFLLVAGNPLKDLAHLATPTGVMARGRWFTGEQLHVHLDRLRQ